MSIKFSEKQVGLIIYLYYSYNHKVLRMQYSVLSYLGFVCLRRCEATYVDLDCSSCISFNG